jgi:hypothetical protein
VAYASWVGGGGVAWQSSRKDRTPTKSPPHGTQPAPRHIAPLPRRELHNHAHTRRRQAASAARRDDGPREPVARRPVHDPVREAHSRAGGRAGYRVGDLCPIAHTQPLLEQNDVATPQEQRRGRALGPGGGFERQRAHLRPACGGGGGGGRPTRRASRAYHMVPGRCKTPHHHR